jgi:hypothetical protein
MAAARCKVSFTDSDGLSHAVHVEAESLYEAVAHAIAEFRDDHMVSKPAPTTEFTVAIERPLILVRRAALLTSRTRPELDCANSSDALLMNIFCYPGVGARKRLCALLGIASGLRPQFGVGARIPAG